MSKETYSNDYFETLINHLSFNNVEITNEMWNLIEKTRREISYHYKQLNTYPTQEEVCKALSEMEGITEVSYRLKHSHYEGDTMDFLMFRGRYGFYLSELRLSDLIKYPNVLKIVGRFYEGEIENE